MKYAMLAAVLFVSSSLVACAPDASNFSCGTATCSAATQYCEQSTTGGTTTSTCKALPASCSGMTDFCDTGGCLNTLPNRTACLRLTINNTSQYTVSITP